MFPDRLPAITLICYRLRGSGYAGLIWFVILESIQSHERLRIGVFNDNVSKHQENTRLAYRRAQDCSSDILLISGIIRKLSLHYPRK
jgi:hypothetical protein